MTTTSCQGTGLPRAYLRPCLLLLLGDGPSHGYELLESIRELGMDTAEAGGLYRSLRSMDEDGLVRSWWEPSESGPARRTYEITRHGTRTLRTQITEIESVAALLTGLVGRHRTITGAT